MRRNWIVLILLTISFFHTPPLKGEEEKKMSSLEKSLVLPGWGQISEKRYLEGIIFASAELFCIGGIIKNQREGNKYYKLYKNADNTQDAIKFRELTIKFDKRRNRFIAGAIAVWGLNLIDMSLKTKKKKNIILKFGGESIEVSFKREF